jgi:hypothetical protein
MLASTGRRSVTGSPHCVARMPRGDRSIGANVLAFMSLQAVNLEQYGEAIRLAEAARQGYGRGRVHESTRC